MIIALPKLNILASVALPLVILGAPSKAQDPGPTAMVIAVPTLATAQNVDTDAGKTWALANQIADLIKADLRSTASFIVADSSKVRIPSFPEVTAPTFAQWRSVAAKFLLQGFVNARSDGRLTIGCYLYDVQSGREVARQGFAVAPNEWRRAAHRCADTAYVKATGNSAQFDSRIAYVASSGSTDALVKKIAVMDFDGANHAFLTDGSATVLTPKWSPKGDRIAYTSIAGGHLQVRIADVGSSGDRPLLSAIDETFAPAFSPDGTNIALSMSNAGNIDIYETASTGSFPKRLTTSPAIDTGPSYSPDGKSIAFVSDRSGTPQLYVMNADGSNQHRVSFGPGSYGSPAWSPNGDRIAFTRVEGATSRIGTMATNGGDERIITNGPNDEQPGWNPAGSSIVFQRQDPGTRRSTISAVPAAGGDVRVVPTPQGASDPSWSERKE